MCVSCELVHCWLHIKQMADSANGWPQSLHTTHCGRPTCRMQCSAMRLQAAAEATALPPLLFTTCAWRRTAKTGFRTSKFEAERSRRRRHMRYYVMFIFLLFYLLHLIYLINNNTLQQSPNRNSSQPASQPARKP